jgi:hypothetical protein
MPSVFTDVTANSYDLTITTAADWTIHSGDLPNGDNSASLVTTRNENAFWAGEDFCLPNGAGSEVRTLEFWVNVTANTTARQVACVRTNSTSTGTTLRQWACGLLADESIVFSWYNTSGTNYLTVNSGVLSTGWRYVVIQINCGSSKAMEIFVDTSSVATSSTTSGTPNTASSNTYEFYLGASRTNATEEMTDHLAKVAWYETALTTEQKSDHYLAMTAT